MFQIPFQAISWYNLNESDGYKVMYSQYHLVQSSLSKQDSSYHLKCKKCIYSCLQFLRTLLLKNCYTSWIPSSLTSCTSSRELTNFLDAGGGAFPWRNMESNSSWKFYKLNVVLKLSPSVPNLTPFSMVFLSTIIYLIPNPRIHKKSGKMH